MRDLIGKLIDIFVDVTSIIEVDENGVEYKKPWTLKEFAIGQVIVGIIFIIMCY